MSISIVLFILILITGIVMIVLFQFYPSKIVKSSTTDTVSKFDRDKRIGLIISGCGIGIGFIGFMISMFRSLFNRQSQLMQTSMANFNPMMSM